MVRTPPHRTLLAITMVIAGAAAGIGTGTVDAQDLIFADGFESGDLSGWGAPAAAPTVRFAESAVSVDEGAGTLELLVEIDEPNGSEVVVEWSTENLTAFDGQDFEGTSGFPGTATLTITAGQSSGTIEIEILDEVLVESPESFLVTISGLKNASLGEPFSCEVTIVDNDTYPELHFEYSEQTFSEADGTPGVYLTLSALYPLPVGFAANTIDGTAVGGEDFESTDGSGTIDPNSNYSVVPIIVINDDIYEGPEYFEVELSNPVNAVLVEPFKAAVKIEDDDPPPEISFTQNALEVSEGGGSIRVEVTLSAVSGVNASVHYELVGGSATPGEDFVLASDILDIVAGAGSASITVVIENDLIVEGNEEFTIILSDPIDAALGIDPVATVTILDDEPKPVISSPLLGTFFYDGDVFDIDARGSLVPQGWDIWLSVLTSNGEDPMPIVSNTSELGASFTAAGDDSEYVVRLVIAAPGGMPGDAVLRGAALPCEFGVDGYECAAAEVRLVAAEYWHVEDFETSYALPGGVFLRWKRIEQAWIERSEDGGETWVRIDDYPHSLSRYFYIDDDVQEGATYYYRILVGPGKIYLGRTDQGPGAPVTIPVWSAPRPVPELLSVDWDCPAGAAKQVCEGLLTLRLVPEPGESLGGATISAFLNEATFQQENGIGEDARIEWPDNLDHFEGRDVPACVVRREAPDLVLEVPGDQDQIQLSLNGAQFGVNGLRFEVRTPNGGYSERAILVVIHDRVVQDDYDAPYYTLKPLLTGDTVATSDFALRGIGPASRYSPDCQDGDRMYIFSKDYDSGSIYGNFVDFPDDQRQFVGTDENGRWSLPPQTLADGEYDLYRRTVTSNFYGYGAASRNILAEDGGLITDRHTVYVYCNTQSPTTPLTVDSTITDRAPQLDHVPLSIYVDAGETEATGQIAFRITDADQDLRFDDVRVSNLSLAQPQQVRAFYADDQQRPEGQWGWFVVELPMIRGENTLEFCAQDEDGHVLGTVEEPCVTATVSRESPLVIATITDPPSDLLSAPPGSIVHLDGSHSTLPEGGVALWTTGWDSPYIGTDWEILGAMNPTGNVADLATSIIMPTNLRQRYRARLIVAATPDDLPDPLWPEYGELPCERGTSGGRCDSADVRLDPECILDPSFSPVEIDEPTYPARFGLTDTVQLSARVSDSGHAPYAFRWYLYQRTTGTRSWLVTIIGADNGSDGFSTENDHISIVPSEVGLSYGEYSLIAEARYPASGCAGPEWFSGTRSLTIKIGHSLDGIAPGTVAEGDWFRVYSSSLADLLEPGELGVILVDDDDEPYDDQLVQYLVPMTEGGYFEVPVDPQDMPANGGTNYYIRVAENQSWDGLSSSVMVRVVPPGNDENPNVVPEDEPTSCGGGVVVNGECAQPIVPGQMWRGLWAESGDSDYLTFLAGAGTGVRVTLEDANSNPLEIHNSEPTAPEVLLARPDGLVVASSDPMAQPASDAMVEATLSMDGRYFVIARSGRGPGAYVVKLERTATGGSGDPVIGFTETRSYLATSTTPHAWFRAPLLDVFGEPLSGAAVRWHEGFDCGNETFCDSGAVEVQYSSVDGLVEHVAQSEAGVVQLWNPQALLPTPPEAKRARSSMRVDSLVLAGEEPVLGRIWTDGIAVKGVDIPDRRTVHEILEKHRLRETLRKSQFTKDGPLCNAAELTCAAADELVFSVAQLSLNPGEQLVDIQVQISKDGEVVEHLDGEEVVTGVPLTVEANVCIQSSTGIDCSVPLDGPVALLVSRGHGAALEQDGVICSQLVGSPGDLTYWVGRDAFTRVTEDVDEIQIRRVPMEWIDAVVVGNIMVPDGQGGFYPVSRRADTTVESTPQKADACDFRPYPPPPSSGWIPEIAGEGPVRASAGAMRQHVGSFYMVDACGNLLDDLGDGQSVRVMSPVLPPVGVELDQTAFGWQWHMGLVGTQVAGEPPNQTVDIPGGLYQIDLEVDSESVCSNSESVLGHFSVNYLNGRPRLELKWDIGRGVEPDERALSVAPGDNVGNRFTDQVVWRIRPGQSGTEFKNTQYFDVPVRAFIAETLVWFDADGEVTEHISPVSDVTLCSGTLHRLYDPETMEYPGIITVTCNAQHDDEAALVVSTEEPGAWADEAYNGFIGTTIGVSRAPSRPGRYYLMIEPSPGPNGDPFRRDGAWEIDTENNREFCVLPMDLEVQYLAENRGPPPHEAMPGAGVVVNADDDDADGTPDHLQIGPVNDEDNLIPARIVLHDSLLDEGEAVLRRSGNQIKVWSSPEKGAAAEVLTDDSVSEKVWDLTDPDERADFEAVRDNLWIEGCAGSLEPRDVDLSFTYRNGDAEGTDRVLVSAIPLEITLYPDEAISVSADDAETFLVVGVLSPKVDDENNPVEDGTRVDWEVVGGEGGLLEEGQTQTEEGYSITTLSTSRAKDSSYVAEASMSELVYDGISFEIGDFAQLTAPIVVRSGVATDVLIEPQDLSYAADNTSSIRLLATFEDSHENPVGEGTPVDWGLDGLGHYQLGEVEAGTDADGKVRATLIAGFLDIPQIPSVKIDGSEFQATVSNDVIYISLTSELSSMEVCTGEQSLLAATFYRPNGDPIADGTPVNWFTSSGRLESVQTTTQNGIATAVLDSTLGKITEGLTEGTEVIVTLKNFSESITIPFFSSAERWIAVPHPVIVGTATEDGLVGIEQIDGSEKFYEYYASTDAHLRGEPFESFRVAPLGEIDSSLFGFDEVNAGTTLDDVTMESAIVDGAMVDDLNFVEGDGSFRFDGGGSVVASDHPAYDFDDGFSFSSWVYPTASSPSTIAEKPGEFELVVDTDGFVTFTVITSVDVFAVTSEEPLQNEEWQLVDAEFVDGRVQISVGRNTWSSLAIGAPVGGAADLSIGSGFIGNLDHVSVRKVTEGSDLIEIDGVDQNNTVTLDANGEAVLTIRSTGVQQTPIERLTIRATVITSSKFGAEKLIGANPCLFHTVISLEEPRIYGWIANLFEGYLTGQGEGATGFVGDVAAGILIWGDLRDCGIQAFKALHPNSEAEWDVFGFAAAGLFLEIWPGVGDPVDSVLAAVKSALKLLPEGPLRRIVADIPVRMVSLAQSGGWDAVKKYADDTWEFLKYLFEEATPAQLERWSSLITSSETFEIATRVFRDVCGHSKENACFEWFERIFEEFPEHGDEVIEIFDELDDGVQLAVRQSDLAGTGLGRLLERGVDPDMIQEALNRVQAFEGSHYSPTKLLEDAEKLVENSTDLMPSQINQQLSEISRSTAEHFHGYTFEFRAAAHISDSLGDAVVDLKTFDDLGIDCLAKEGAYQMKRSASALIGDKTLKEFDEYLKRGLTAAEKERKAYRIALPNGVKDQLAAGVREKLEKYGLFDTIVEIPDFYKSWR